MDTRTVSSCHLPTEKGVRSWLLAPCIPPPVLLSGSPWSGLPSHAPLIQKGLIYTCRLGLPPGLLLPAVCHLVALGVLSTLEGSVGCPYMGVSQLLDSPSLSSQAGDQRGLSWPHMLLAWEERAGVLGGQHTTNGQWLRGMPVSSCRDDTTINQTAPMHSTCSPHTAGPVCGGARTGKNCSGLLGKALWVLSMLCSGL